MIKPTSKIAKGKLLEEWIANHLIQSGLDPTAIRQKGSGSGLAKGDIHTQLEIHFEAKNQKQFLYKQWKKQIDEENVSHLDWVIVWHPPQVSLEDSLVIIDWDYFERLLVISHGTHTIAENPKLKYPLIQLKELCRKILKELE